MKVRVVYCSCCSKRVFHGTSQVFLKMLFHFCEFCWFGRREDCNTLMRNSTAAALQAAKKEAA